MICRFCSADFDQAKAKGLFLTDCPEHHSPICPECFCCQAVEPTILTTRQLVNREFTAQRWRDAT